MKLSGSSSAAIAAFLIALRWTIAVRAEAFVPTSHVGKMHGRGISSKPSFRKRAMSDDGGHSQSSIEPSTDIPRGGASLSKKPPSQPTLAQLRQFALPCLGLWVAQPLLSLVDTAFVGLSSGAATSAQQLAALGPATTFFDGATYLFAFLNVATTNLYSSARAQQGEKSDKAESVVRTAARVAFRCGVGIMIFLLSFARPLLALYIGTSPDRRTCNLFAQL